MVQTLWTGPLPPLVKKEKPETVDVPAVIKSCGQVIHRMKDTLLSNVCQK